MSAGMEKTCIAVYDSAQLAEEKRMALLDAGVRLAWADDFKTEIAGGYCLYVRPEDARGAYVRLKRLEQ